MDSSEWMTIGELVDWANAELGLEGDMDAPEDLRPVTRRTIYFYISEGLLPPAEGSGTASVYGPRHRLVLKLIKLCQSAHMPLRKIKSRIDALQGVSDHELAEQIARMERIQPPLLDADVADLRMFAQDARMFWSAERRQIPGAGESAFQRNVPIQRGSDLWKRVELVPGVEMHYQVTGNRKWESFLDGFITDARLKLRKKQIETDR